MTEDVKFCRDCKFYKPGSLLNRLFYTDTGLCTKTHWNERSKIEYLVTREKGEQKYFHASLMRTFSHECGNDAKWFEPKE